MTVLRYFLGAAALCAVAPALALLPDSAAPLAVESRTGERIDNAPIAAHDCSALDKLRLVNATVGSATGVTEGATYYCRVAGVARPTADSYVNFEIWLPPPSKWNGKIFASSGGTALGGILQRQLRKGIARGYAAMSNDRGHAGRDDRGAPFGGDGSWALGHPEKIIDWSYRAEHVSAVATKVIVAAYYGQAPEQAYFESCSSGGQQAIMAAERFPADYDGIIAAAPAIRMNYSMANVLNQMIPGPLSELNKLSDDKLAALNKAAINACDGLDGLKDGLISRPLACKFDPAVLACKSGDGPDCLTGKQIETARRYYSGMKRRNGALVAEGYGAPPGSELEWSSNIHSTRPTMIFHFFKYWVYQNPDYDVTTFDFDKDFDRLLITKLGSRHLARLSMREAI